MRYAARRRRYSLRPMRPFVASVLPWFLPLVLVPGPRAQDTPVVTCSVCLNKGCTPCGKHGKMLEQEQVEHGVLFCSVAAECKTCGGTLAIDCKACVNPGVEDALEKRRQLVKQWLAARRKANDEVTDNQPLFHLDTPHCKLVFSIKPLTIGKIKYDTHQLMHLYGERIEALRELFKTTFEIRDADLPATLDIYMFRDAQDQTKMGPIVTGMGGNGATGTKLMGAPAVYSMWMEPRAIPNDEALHRTMVHNIAHLLLSNMTPSQWLGNRKYGWIDAGVAHWFEDKVTGKCTNFCYEEVALQPGAGFKGGAWRPPVRKLVDEGGAVAFADLAQRNTDQLSFVEHAVAFAYVDFLIAAHGGAKFRDMLRMVKKDVPTRDALQTVYGLNPLSIDGAFQQWVKENYTLPR